MRGKGGGLGGDRRDGSEAGRGRGKAAGAREPSRATERSVGRRERMADWRNMVVGGVLEQLDDDDEITECVFDVLRSVHDAGAGFRRGGCRNMDVLTLPRVWLTAGLEDGMLEIFEGGTEWYVNPPLLLYWCLPGGPDSTVETNIPLESNPRPWLTNGAIGRSPNGDDFLLFRGGIGGGKKGVGKTAFWQEYRGPKALLNCRGRVDEVAVVGQLRHPDFTDQAAEFVAEVARIKKVIGGVRTTSRR